MALLDSTQAGQTSQALLGVGGDIPVVGRLDHVPQANTLLIGIAPSGGQIPPAWRSILLDAISRKMDIVSGLHEFLCDDPELTEAARRHEVQLWTSARTMSTTWRSEWDSRGLPADPDRRQ